ncbi:uncharacterized protein LOC114930272 isoform X2 [Nylanderia fulva]|uniref:uncharacterized protein LOC114930272 isoform X2 n=1 Tax=Nylanderia fulva TaxID=613905 RepID=UPI0010FB1CF1|nr:uncharacterized protein LOC114930272 isoform X2 [Nylanderia fulva]
MSESYKTSVVIEGIDFTFQCLQKIIHIMPRKDIVFSSNSLYEGLMMVYRASSNETKEQLKSILQLPIHLGTKFWALDKIMEEREKIREKKRKEETVNVHAMDVCCREHCCWIKDTKCYKKNNHLTPENCRLFDHSNIPNVMNDINEVLKNEMQGYIPQPVVFNSFNNNMEFILSYGLRLKSHQTPVAYPSSSTTNISRKFGMFVTKIVFTNEMLLFALFPAAQELARSNIWKIDEDISGLVKRLATKEQAEMLRETLFENELEKLPEENTIYPDNFELEHELPIDQLLEMLNIKHVLSPEKASLFGFTKENLHLGGANHRAYIKFTSKDVTANAINIFYTESGGSFTSMQEHNNCTKYENSFVWLLCNKQYILFTGVVNKNC